MGTFFDKFIKAGFITILVTTLLAGGINVARAETLADIKAYQRAAQNHDQDALMQREIDALKGMAFEKKNLEGMELDISAIVEVLLDMADRLLALEQ